MSASFPARHSIRVRLFRTPAHNDQQSDVSHYVSRRPPSPPILDQAGVRIKRVLDTMPRIYKTTAKDHMTWTIVRAMVY